MKHLFLALLSLILFACNSKSDKQTSNIVQDSLNDEQPETNNANINDDEKTRAVRINLEGHEFFAEKKEKNDRGETVYNSNYLSFSGNIASYTLEKVIWGRYVNKEYPIRNQKIPYKIIFDTNGKIYIELEEGNLKTLYEYIEREDKLKFALSGALFYQSNYTKSEEKQARVNDSIANPDKYTPAAIANDTPHSIQDTIVKAVETSN